MPTILSPTNFIATIGDGTFRDIAVEAGVAFSEDGKARAGMGVDIADFENSGYPGIAVTNFDGEMIGLYLRGPHGVYTDRAASFGRGTPVPEQSGIRLFLL